jgi:hypothetical protein
MIPTCTLCNNANKKPTIDVVGIDTELYDFRRITFLLSSLEGEWQDSR